MRKFLYTLRFLPILIGKKNLPLFTKDLARWKQIKGLTCSDNEAVAKLLWEYPEFRNLYLYRNLGRHLYCWWVKRWYTPRESLLIETPIIGGGLFIQHGFATGIGAQSIGENCWINQQVTIGFTGEGSPVIGDGVTITCGAKVLGKISIGDGAIIGANAVVIRDVEPKAIMVGVPARRIK